MDRELLPKEYKLRMKELLKDEYDEYLRSFETGSYKALRLNPLKAEEAQLLVFLYKYVCREAERVPWEPMGFYYEERMDRQDAESMLPPGKNPLHEAGLYYIQEPSAMKPVTLLEADRAGKPEAEGLKILDLCAAPGGKTTQIAAYMRGRGVLVCNEIITRRAAVLSENIERMGVRNAIVLNETPGRLADYFIDYFDRILVDAPCSGEGMFRKDEGAVSEWSPDNVHMCAERQDEILDCAASMLKPGGVMVYSTCTFSREEDEECIERFLARHRDYELDTREKMLPHRIKGEGHFLARLVRTDNRTAVQDVTDYGYSRHGSYEGTEIEEYLEEDGSKVSGACKKTSGNANMKHSFTEFCHDVLTERAVKSLKGRLIWFGDNLYLMPERAPAVDGLKVMRPGLQLGTFRKDRFEPAHALALALDHRAVKKMVNITLKSASVYIAGMTLSCERDNIGFRRPDEEKHESEEYETGGNEAEAYEPEAYEAEAGELKGWVLVCCEGISLGWGKVVGDVIKNHYPKGLRKQP